MRISNLNMETSETRCALSCNIATNQFIFCTPFSNRKEPALVEAWSFMCTYYFLLIPVHDLTIVGFIITVLNIKMYE